MEFQLINKELAEAKLYRTSRQFGALDGRTIADLTFLLSMTTYMVSRMDEGLDELGRGYAKATQQYGTYALFRTHATDLYLLCYQIKNPGNDNIKLRDHVTSKKFLNTLNFNSKNHITFMRKIVGGFADDRMAQPFFFRLEQQLKITDARYKQWRRVINNWEKASQNTKDVLKQRLVTELRRLGARGSELFPIVMGTLTLKRKREVWKGNKEKEIARPDTARRLAGTVAGAVAGRYAAGKLAGMDKKKAKNVGTGLGAIAGYWASGRRKV